MITQSQPKAFGVYFILASAFCMASSISAATINVTANAVDTTVNGNCSLVEAIQAANTDAAVDACTAGSGADTITLRAGTDTLTIAGGSEDDDATGDLDDDDDVTINGAAAATIVDAGALDRPFEQSSPPCPLSRHPERGA